MLKGDLNVFQRFAAQYQVRRNRERLVEDIEDTLKKQTWYQHPLRYSELFPPENPWTPDPLDLHGSAPEEVVDDLDEIDRYFAELENKRSVSGEEVFTSLDGNDFAPLPEGDWL